MVPGCKNVRCKLLFVSVGAGPIYSRAGRFFVKAALFLADFRSYRDASTLEYLRGIGFRVGDDPIRPDLAFSLPETSAPQQHEGENGRLVVGLGLMEYAWKYSVEKPTSAVYSAYLEVLVETFKVAAGPRLRCPIINRGSRGSAGHEGVQVIVEAALGDAGRGQDHR